MRRVVPTQSYEAGRKRRQNKEEEGGGGSGSIWQQVRGSGGGLQDLGDVDVVVERPVGGAVVILAAVIVQAGHRSSCASFPRPRPNAAASSRVLLRFALPRLVGFRNLDSLRLRLVSQWAGRVYRWVRVIAWLACLPASAALLASRGLKRSLEGFFLRRAVGTPVWFGRRGSWVGVGQSETRLLLLYIRNLYVRPRAVPTCRVTFFRWGTNQTLDCSTTIIHFG